MAAQSLAWRRGMSKSSTWNPIDANGKNWKGLVRVGPNWMARRALLTKVSEWNDGIPTFEGLGLDPELLFAIREMGLREPTEIQSMSIPEVSRGGDVLLASHTGSGKTLAYLLPLVQKLREDERSGIRSRSKHPRALVMGPTRELAMQVLQVAKSLSHHAKFRSSCISGGGKFKVQKDALVNPLDLVVGTPGRILQHIEEGNLHLGDMKYLVLDEADTMFDAGFGPEIRKIIRPLRSREPDDGQCILVSATLTGPVQKLLTEEFPNMRKVFTDSLHKSVAEARHSFVQVGASENKLRVLEDLIRGEYQRGKRVMVFCNTVGSCRAVDHHLNEGGFRTVNYHGDMPRSDRASALMEFGAEDAPVPVLVCTDLAARGLDFNKSVGHVVMFDFPLNPVDYIHRTGRTARAGETGRVTSLVIKRDVVLAQRIERAIRSNEPLDALSSDRRRMVSDDRSVRSKREKESGSLRNRDDSHRRKGGGSSRGTRGAARFEGSEGSRRRARVSPGTKRR